MQVVGGRCRLEELTQLLEELLCRGGGRLAMLELQVLLGGGEEWRGSSIVVWRSSLLCWGSSVGRRRAIGRLGRSRSHLGMEGGPHGGHAGLQ